MFFLLNKNHIRNSKKKLHFYLRNRFKNNELQEDISLRNPAGLVNQQTSVRVMALNKSAKRKKETKKTDKLNDKTNKAKLSLSLFIKWVLYFFSCVQTNGYNVSHVVAKLTYHKTPTENTEKIKASNPSDMISTSA